MRDKFYRPATRLEKWNSKRISLIAYKIVGITEDNRDGSTYIYPKVYSSARASRSNVTQDSSMFVFCGKTKKKIKKNKKQMEFSCFNADGGEHSGQITNRESNSILTVWRLFSFVFRDSRGNFNSAVLTIECHRMMNETHDECATNVSAQFTFHICAAHALTLAGES